MGDSFKQYAVGAKAGGLSRDALVNAGTSVLRAIAAIREDLRKGDVILIKGRDTQRLDRVALSMAGRQVRCEVKFCRAYPTRCERCPMLERGWRGLRVVI